MNQENQTTAVDAISLSDGKSAEQDNAVQDTSHTYTVQRAFKDFRQFKAFVIRENAAFSATEGVQVVHEANKDKETYGAFTRFSKTLKHNGLDHPKHPGQVDAQAYENFEKAVTTDKPESINLVESLFPGDTGNTNEESFFALTNPLAGYAYDLEGYDAQKVTLHPAPAYDGEETAAEMAELYWMALVRDVPFEEYAVNNTVKEAVEDLSESYSFFKKLNGFNASTLFRASLRLRKQDPQAPHGFAGVSKGPFISQFLIRGTKEQGVPVTDGVVKVGTLRVSQRQRTVLGGNDVMEGKGELGKEADFMFRPEDWFEVQQGIDKSNTDNFNFTALRFIRNGRDLANYVHFDKIYQEYYIAACILLDEVAAAAKTGEGQNSKASTGNINIENIFRANTGKVPNEALNVGNPYAYTSTQTGFATFGLTFITTLLAAASTRAHKCVWHQKWQVHRRLRPEEFGGHVHFHLQNKTKYPIHRDLVGPDAAKPEPAAVLRKIASKYSDSGTSHYFLPQVFPEGSPTHPSYGAGHATLAGAAVTILKALFKQEHVIPDCVRVKPGTEGAELELLPRGEQGLTVGGELNKLASNIAFGRSIAGVHWRSDNTESLLLGEEIAIELLREITTKGKYSSGGTDYIIPFYREVHPASTRFAGRRPFFRLTTFDGVTIDIEDGEVWRLNQDGSREEKDGAGNKGVQAVGVLQDSLPGLDGQKNKDNSSRGIARDPEVKEVSDAAQRLIQEVFNDLNKASSITTPTDNARLFFPNGIELIDLGITVGPRETPLIDVKVKIAGKAGDKTESNAQLKDTDKHMPPEG